MIKYQELEDKIKTTIDSKLQRQLKLTAMILRLSRKSLEKNKQKYKSDQDLGCLEDNQMYQIMKM